MSRYYEQASAFLTRSPNFREWADHDRASDSFDAGLIVSRLRGETLEQSARFACICGALNIRAARG